MFARFGFSLNGRKRDVWIETLSGAGAYNLSIQPRSYERKRRTQKH